MPITYTSVTRRIVEERKVVTLTARTHWACYTSRTNTSLRKKAETLIDKTEKASNRIQLRNAAFAFYKGWFKMCDSTEHQNAGVSDTAVREIVRSFVEQVLRASGKFGDPSGAEEEIYRDVESLPREQLTHRSNRK